jgi:predicted acyltransferase
MHTFGFSTQILLMASLSQRFTALDVFRGMTVCFMIIVNTPGNGNTSYSPLNHAVWHGFTPTDLVFPSFLFAVGNSISFVMKRWVEMDKGKVIWKILKRTFIIFLLGYLMYWFPFVRYEDGQYVGFPFTDTRVFGVLQRIALCYGIASLMDIWLKPKALAIWGVAFLLLYWVLAYALGDAIDPLSLHGNAVLRVDRMLLPDSHLYHGNGGVAFDPEGLLSTLPSIVNVLAGIVVGSYLQKKGKNYETLTGLLLAGCALVAIGSFWHLLFPINKKLWTSSFVVYTVGLDCIILSAVIYISDLKQRTRWNYFFEVFGRNTLFIYLLSELLVITIGTIRVSEHQNVHGWLFETLFKPFGMYNGSLLFAIWFMLVCWLVGYFLDKKKIYVKV